MHNKQRNREKTDWKKNMKMRIIDTICRYRSNITNFEQRYKCQQLQHFKKANKNDDIKYITKPQYYECDYFDLILNRKSQSPTV
mmetsp:Transcript_14907/g.13381  ORF Transcript_14907/g.13381 Transcript_14907/m.13381 type:complete len:84 (+) Transcript_14907:77-328(+)